MKDIFDKISSYNLFNYLLPGMVFTYLVITLTPYKILSGFFVVDIFIVYFIGLVISRFGSLVLEPFLRKISFLKYVEYHSYVTKSKKDPKIELLSEVNNSYRTFVSLFILFVLVKLWIIIDSKIAVINETGPYVLIVLLILIFLYSYKKQTSYIVKRIKANKL